MRAAHVLIMLALVAATVGYIAPPVEPKAPPGSGGAGGEGAGGEVPKSFFEFPAGSEEPEEPEGGGGAPSAYEISTGLGKVTFFNNDVEYENAVVYHQDDDVRFGVSLEGTTPDTIHSEASITEERTKESAESALDFRMSPYWQQVERQAQAGGFDFDLEVSDLDSEIGAFSGQIYNVFRGEHGDFTKSGKYLGNSDVLGPIDFLIMPKLHTRDKRILAAGARLAGGTYGPYSFARNLTHEIKPKLLIYDDGLFGLHIHRLSDFSILDKKKGHCVDFTTIYMSICRAYNIPVRPVHMRFKGSGHAFAEVRLGNRWVHAEPQGYFDYEDDYVIINEYRDISVYIEEPPGQKKADIAETLRYSITPKGIVNRSIPLYVSADTKSTSILIKNHAAKTDKWWNPFDSETNYAKNFRLSGIGDLIQLEGSGFEGDGILMPGESKWFPLNIGGNLEVGTIEVYSLLSFDSSEGKSIKKPYYFKIKVV